MANWNSAGKVQTVLGPMDPGQLGATMTHEHLMQDVLDLLRPPSEASAKDFYYKPVSFETVGRIRHYSAPNADNACFFDIPIAIEEANLYKQHGGNSMVDTTPIRMGRDPTGLARISRATGVNVIMGGSYYVHWAHPPDMDSRSEDEITREIVQDITEGVDGTNIKSGVIGEVGCTWPLAENERKVLRASARAQRLTGAPITIHPGEGETAPLEIMEVLTEAGGNPDHIIVGHLDRTIFLRDTLKKLAETGCYMQWDLFGIEQSYYWLDPNIDMPSDAKRMDDVAWISSEGYGRKILISHDVGMKHRLEKYGGHGYSYILGHIVPRMRTRGYTEEAIDDIVVNNPKAVLTFTEPEK